MVGDQVKIKNIESVNNPLNTYKVGYNGEFEIDQVISSKGIQNLAELQQILVYSLTKLTREQPNNRSKIFL